MYLNSILQQIENALGKRHENPNAALYERIDFICRAIKQLKQGECQHVNVDQVDIATSQCMDCGKLFKRLNIESEAKV